MCRLDSRAANWRCTSLIVAMCNYDPTLSSLSIATPDDAEGPWRPNNPGNRRSDDGQVIYFNRLMCDRGKPCQHGQILETRDSMGRGSASSPPCCGEKNLGWGANAGWVAVVYTNVAHPKVGRASDILPEARGLPGLDRAEKAVQEYARAVMVWYPGGVGKSCLASAPRTSNHG